MLVLYKFIVKVLLPFTVDIVLNPSKELQGQSQQSEVE